MSPVQMPHRIAEKFCHAEVGFDRPAMHGHRDNAQADILKAIDEVVSRRLGHGRGIVRISDDDLSFTLIPAIILA
jgi:hypothetical protein